jgi:isoquinoline 1-oxidoreductase
LSRPSKNRPRDFRRAHDRELQPGPGLEPERYELKAPVAYLVESNRREFFKILGAGLLVFGAIRSASGAQESGGARRSSEESLPQDISAWLHIGETGTITVFTGKVEVGQNIRTSLTQAVAEELNVLVASIKMVMGDTALCPFDMGTFGSRTTPVMNLQLRKVASAAREALIEMAAANWKVNAKNLKTAQGKVSDPASGREIKYAELVKGRQIAQAIPAEDPLIPPAKWTIAGQSNPKIDGREFVTGKHRYPSDQRLPNMLHGKVLRPERFNAAVVSLDTAAAEKIPGVTVVHDGDFIGVAAGTVEEATRATKLIDAKWKAETQPSNKDLYEYLKQNEETGGDSHENSVYSAGSIEKALSGAEHRLQQTYHVAYIAHAPLEPRAALAEWKGDQLSVWTGTQRPFGVRSELAKAFRIPEENIRVQMPDMGSGYGGKHTGEAAIEAARLARAAKRPVKIVWTREEEFTWAYFRPAGVIELTSAVSSDGKITAWEFHNYNSGTAGIRTYYDIPNQKIEFHPVNSPLRQGSYRGLASTANHFARETHMDELANVIGLDPLEFRLRNLKEPRLLAVFEEGAKKFGWGKTKPAHGVGFGMGGGYEKLGYVATFAEVHVDRATGKVAVTRIVTAFECGAIVNSDGLRNQVEGANVMGIGGALFEAIQFENGRILNPRFSQYRVPRFKDLPKIETVLINREDLPSAGAGEAPIVGIAPAIGNAIFQASGVRLRELPLAPDGLKVAAKS